MRRRETLKPFGIIALTLAMGVPALTTLGALRHRAGVTQESSRQESTSADEPIEDVDFARDIQPLFQQRCYSCHGADDSESGLRLDQKQAAMLGGDRGRILLAGDPKASRLIDVLTGEDEDVGLMPPDGEGTPFSVAEIDLVKKWITQGAQWPESDKQIQHSTHWAYRPIIRPRPPEVMQRDWGRSPIDDFILEKLEQGQIAPSSRASRTTLIRRVYLDLLGLPPAPEQVERFLTDREPGSYERLIDRVLASPHFGERWGRHWLDLARYADTDGYEKDRSRPNAWRYRDWVIDALNQDLSYADFSRWQLAGDMFPEASAAQRVASGFHRNTLHNTEGGIDPEEDRFKKTIDRTNTFGAIWLGMTVGCAQCHSHKYDPLTQREYYSLYAYFNQIDETDVAGPVAIDSIDFAKAKQQHQETMATLREKVAAIRSRDNPEAQSAWEARTRKEATVWHEVAIDSFQSKNGAGVVVDRSQQVIVTGPNEKSDYYALDVSLPIQTFNAIRLEVLPAQQLPQRGPGRAENGNFVLAELSISNAADTTTPTPSASRSTIKLASALADFSQNGFDVGRAINGNTTDGWAVSPQMGARHVAVFQLEQDCTLAGRKLRIELDQSYPNNPHNLGSFRISVAHVRGQASLEGIAAELANALELPQADRDAAAQATIATAYRASLDRELASLNEQLEQLSKAAPTLDQFKARGVSERAQPRPNPMYVRGDFLRPGDMVEPKTPSVLSFVAAGEGEPNRQAVPAPQDRRELADWLFAVDHPLTSRVAANRIWFRLFGRGLVTTIDDFGMQSDPPSHPELLDWLACELRDNGWSVKHLVRQIVLSSTYQQRADYRPELVDRDPNNRWLARQNRRRVEAEIVRDLALAAAGLLDERIGGPSVRPPQPTEYSSLTYADSAQWKTSEGGDAYRRGMYTFFQRTSPYPMLTTFDCPDSNQTTTQRNVSNTAIQSLTLWNDPVFFDCARALAARVLSVRDRTHSDATSITSIDPHGHDGNKSVHEADRDALFHSRLRYAFRCCLSRDPTDAEIATLRELYKGQTNLLNSTPGASEAILGNVELPPAIDANEFASWVIVARTLINLDEFIMKE